MLLHAAVSGLFTKLASDLFAGQRRPTLVAGLLFVTHPVHTEAVAGLVGRADCAAALFFLLSLMAYIHFVRLREYGPWPARVYLYLSLILAACAMLSKEHGITVLAVAAVYHICLYHKLWPFSVEAVRAIITEVSQLAP